MKLARILVAMLALSVFGSALGSEDRTITKVVKLLTEMLDQSKSDGEAERVVFAKYKCYFDTNEASKVDSIARLTEEIGLLESAIDALQGSNGALSTECADLSASIAANEEARTSAEALRRKENAAFVAEKQDLEGAIAQMSDAISTLAAIGADQSLADSAGDNKKFMAGFGSAKLLKLQSSVKQALIAASVFLGPKAKTTVDSFLQAPFTGSYASQSGAVVGMLKEMEDTFKANLATAEATEKVQEEAHQKFMKTKLDAYNEMKAAYEKKQGMLGNNDGDLGAKKTQLQESENQKANDEDFLAKLRAMYAEKSTDYENRKQLRANEDAAIAEAISILDSDAAFATFGKVSATSTGATGFLQLKAVRAHAPAESARVLAQRLLQKVMSPRLVKVAAMLQANNPFTEVLKEIKKMVGLIVEEGKADKDNLDWCNSERTDTNNQIDSKSNEIAELDGKKLELEDSINNPTSGLKFQIASTEAELAQNHQDQVDETKDRQEENVAYQKDVGHLVNAEELLARAVKVLNKYYASIESLAEANALLQDDPAPPATWEGDYKGQSGQGNSAISMIEFILSETKKEEAEAHKDEKDAQHAYEDSMADLKEKEANAQKSLANLHKELADAKKDLVETVEALGEAKKELAAAEAYLLKIKPGCDFITTHFDEREANRATEKTALESAIELLKGTPAFQAAETAAHEESLGKCKDICAASEAHVDCKACLADTTVPGYCAGHAGTEGC